MIYVASSGKKSKRVKIGYATEVRSRIEELVSHARLATGDTSFSLHVHATAQGSRAEETAIHAALRHAQILGTREWFAVDWTFAPCPVREFIDRLRTYRVAADAMAACGMRVRPRATCVECTRTFATRNPRRRFCSDTCEKNRIVRNREADLMGWRTDVRERRT